MRPTTRQADCAKKLTDVVLVLGAEYGHRDNEAEGGERGEDRQRIEQLRAATGETADHCPDQDDQFDEDGDDHECRDGSLPRLLVLNLAL